MRKRKEKQCCVFCGTEIEKMRDRHDASPLNIKGSCCANCNSKYVIPARVALWTIELESLCHIYPYLIAITKEELDEIILLDTEHRLGAFLKAVRKGGYKGEILLTGGKRI